MLSHVAGVILDLLIVALLATTIGYCWLLNKRIKILQDSKSELAQLLKYFDESTEKASESIIALQTASKKIGENIQHRVDKANYLVEDLSFMIEKGTKLADQMEASFAVNRAQARVMRDAPAAPSEPEPSLPESAPRMGSHSAKPAAAQPARNAREKTTASLEAALERIVSRTRPAHDDDDEIELAPTRAGKPPRARSKTEQELLTMLKTGLKG